MKKLFILFAAIALVGSFAFSAAAAEWNFYGNSRMQTWYVDNDNDAGDDDGTIWTQQGNSRIGANIKASDTVNGRFEYGTGVNLRLLYATWDFGGGELLLGQGYTPMTHWYSNQVWDSDTDLLSYGGTMYAGRQPMAQLKFGGFKIALVRPATTSLTITDTTTDTVTLTLSDGTIVTYTESTSVDSAADIDATIPKLEMSYHMGSDNLWFDVNFGYNVYDYDAPVNESVSSYVFGGDFGMNFGAVSFTVFGVYGVNAGNYGLATASASGGLTAFNPLDGTYSIIDNDTLGFAGFLTFKASDTVSVEGGMGYVASELDTTGSNKDDEIVYYLNCSITLAPGVFIVPEIDYFDHGEGALGQDQGSAFAVGAKWQINF